MTVAIQRYRDPAHINAILNHADVYPWVRGSAEGPLDVAPILDLEDDVYALFGEYGGQIYHRLQSGIYEAHSQFLPQGRGDYALAVTNASLKWMFTKTEAVEIMTRAPQGNVAAKALAHAVRGQFQWTNPRGWMMDGKPVPAEIWSLTLQEWTRTAPGLVEKGKWFHDRLEAELDRHGVKELAHPEDQAHDRYVGAAVEMFFGGQPHKGAVFYNRFAALGGYHPIRIINESAPLAVDIGSAELWMSENDFFIPSMAAEQREVA